MDTLNGYIERARKFAHEYYRHPRFAGYTETEVAKGCAIALSIVNTYLDAKKKDCLPVPDSEIDRILAAIGVEDSETSRVFEINEIALNILGSKEVAA